MTPLENHGRKLRIGVAGLVHDHVWKELGFWRGCPQAEIVAVTDRHPELMERVERECGPVQKYATAEEMFARESLDALQLCASNRDDVEIGLQALARGIPCLLEKPMAHCLAGADALLEAARAQNVLLAINWPLQWKPEVQTALQQIDAGAIGTVFELNVRMAHEGPRELGCSPYFCNWLFDAEQNGGGALIDYCCYGAALIRLVLGRPQFVFGFAGNLCKQDLPVEDNARLMLIYERALGQTAGSWTQRPWFHELIAYGTEGTLWTLAGKLWIDQSPHGDQPREMECSPLPFGARNAPEQFLNCLASNTPFPGMGSSEISRDAQEILEAGMLSSQTGRRIALPLPSSPSL